MMRATRAKVRVDPEAVEAEIASQFSLGDEGSGHTYYKGRLVHEGDTGERVEVGRFAYHDLEVFIVPGEVNTEAFELMDAENQDTCEVFEALQENGAQVIDDLIRGIVYLRTLFVEPRFRGNGIAASFLKRLQKHVNHGGRDWTVIAVIPHPLDDAGRRLETAKMSAREHTEYEETELRLVALYERAGFRRLGESDVWALGLMFDRPPQRPTAPVAKQT